MDHEQDYDRDHDREDILVDDRLKDILEQSYELETELMRCYIITSERVHNDEVLKERLRNFAEGNAKRTKQLQAELEKFN